MPGAIRLQHVSVPMPPGGAEQARRFYGEALGLIEIKPPSDLAHLALVWFGVGPDGHELHCFTAEQPGPKSPMQHLCLQVDDLPAVTARVAAHGVALEDASPIRNRARVFVHDPFGNLVELTEITGDYD